MSKLRILTAAALVLCLAQICSAQAPPVVTIDSNNRFCVNGAPTFLIGTMGGDATTWALALKPAGFNFRFLGSTASPGAHSVGLWEVPDVFDDPAAVSTMRTDPSYLMWDLGYEIDLKVPYYLDWMDSTVDSIRQKRLQVLANDPVNPRPVGACWGNAKRVAGSEMWGWQGYWTGYRQYMPHTDYMVIGDYDWGLCDETVGHAVRMSSKPVIYMIRSYPLQDPPEGTRPEPHVLNRNIWLAVIAGAKGIVLDRFEMQGTDGAWYNWLVHTGSHWQVIDKACREIRQLENVILTPNPRVYYKTAEPFGLMYTFLKSGNDLYMIAVNGDRRDPQSAEITVPVLATSLTGEVLFDYLARGTVTADPTSTTITDSTKSWTTNQFAGKRLHISHGSPAHDHYYAIASNTANTITISGGNLLTDGVARTNAYEVLPSVTLTNQKFTMTLTGGARQVIRFGNAPFYYSLSKTPAAVGTPSARKWKLLMDYSSQVGTEAVPEDSLGLCYDTHRHRLVAVKGLENYWPQGKPNPTYADVQGSNKVWEWDLDAGLYSGPIGDGEQQGGDPWPTDGSSYSDVSYDPVRRCAVLFNQETREVEEWRGPELGWRRVLPVSGDSQPCPGNISHYAAVYMTSRQRWLFYGGKKWDFISNSGYYREGQFDQEWWNLLHSYDGNYWYLLGNPDANLPITALQEPEMVWDSNRNVAVLFGLSHDGKYKKNSNSFFQDTVQQTYEIGHDLWCTQRATAHVPYVYYNYQMVFDPRTNTTLLFGGWPSVNGRGTDLYEYVNSDWRRLDYDHSAIAAQDARRIPTLVYDPDHQMVLFVDTRARKIWGLTTGTETEVSTIDAVRGLANGTVVSVDAKVVGRCFDGYFYMQEPDRTGGIKVISSSTAVAPGKLVNVIGTVGTLATGEKQITARVVGVAGEAEVEPLAMTAGALGGSAAPGKPGVFQGIGANNTGLVVRVFGRVTAVGSGYVYVDDGTGLADGSGNTGVRVALNGVAAPGLNQYVGVTGISAVQSVAGRNVRVVLTARAEDVRLF